MDHQAAAAVPPAGRGVRAAKDGKTQVIRTRQFWTPRAEATFLEELASTANVTAAAQAAGFSTTAVYKRRMRDAGFAAAWAEAIEQGYARIEAMLIARAADILAREPVVGDDTRANEVASALALNLLRLHRASVRGGAAQRFAHRELPPDMDEVRAGILRKIEAIERAAQRKAEGEGAPSRARGGGGPPG
jgi:hypothetical protein